MRNLRIPHGLVPALILSLLLGACGGGGGGGGGAADGTPATSDVSPEHAMNWVPTAVDVKSPEPDTGYIATSNETQVVVSLPANPAPGALFGVRGYGSAGWRIEQHAGQSIRMGAMAGEIWTAHAVDEPNATSRPWYAVTSSADGSTLVAVESVGRIYISTDSGATWTPQTVESPDGVQARAWKSIAASADGKTLIAAAGAFYSEPLDDWIPDQVYVWTEATSKWLPLEPQEFWSAVAISASGSRLAAATSDGKIYTSIDGGPWTQSREASGARIWGLAYSGDGSKLVAVGAEDQFLVMNLSDGNPQWTRPIGLTVNEFQEWSAVAASERGDKLVAAGFGSSIYTSSDGGLNWTARDSSRDWFWVASSSDGTRLTAAEGCGGHIYTSIDSGVTWTPNGPGRCWYAVASSADGNKLVAVDRSGQIYTSTGSTTVGAAGSVSGGSDDHIELVHVGDGRFEVLGHSTNLTLR